MKTVLLVVNSEKSDLVVTENVHSIEETIIPVVEMTKNEVIGFVHLAETIILLSELNAIVAENQSEVTFRNVAAPSETTVADAETTVVEEDAMIADLVTKNNIIEMTGFVLHVRMTTSLSELNATNVESLDQEETLEEEIHVEATEEVATAADAMGPWGRGGDRRGGYSGGRDGDRGGRGGDRRGGFSGGRDGDRGGRGGDRRGGFSGGRDGDRGGRGGDRRGGFSGGRDGDRGGRGGDRRGGFSGGRDGDRGGRGGDRRGGSGGGRDGERGGRGNDRSDEQYRKARGKRPGHAHNRPPKEIEPRRYQRRNDDDN